MIASFFKIQDTYAQRSLISAKLKKIKLRLLSALFLLSAFCYAEIHIEYSQNESDQENVASSVSITSRSFDLIVAPADAENIETPSNSKAYLIVTYLFGTMDPSNGFGAIVCVPTDWLPCSGLMGKLFSAFNAGVLIIATALLGYVVFQSSFSDASEGLAAGQKYSHSIIPLRSALGMALLIPTKTGYGYGQILLAKILLLGSSAATGLWQYLLLYYDATGEPLGSGGLYYDGGKEVDDGNSIAEGFVQKMAQLSVCNAYLNTPQGLAAQFPTNKPPAGSVFVADFFTLDNSTYEIETGVEDVDPSYSYAMGNNYCGSLSLGPLDSSQFSVISSYKSQIENLSYQFMKNYNFDTNTIPYPQEMQTQFTVLKNMLKTDLLLAAAAEAQNASIEKNDKKTARQASEWLDAPTYFFGMLSDGNPNYSLTINLSPDTGAPTLPTDYERQYVTDFSQEITPSDDVNMTITFPGNSGATKDFKARMKEMFSAVSDTGDALLGLAQVGRRLLKLALDLMIVSFTFSILLVTLTGIASDYTGATTFGLMTGIMTVIISVIQAIGFLIPIASVFAIGLPLIPLMTFTSAIISWIFFFVIGVFAAPIICLGLISHGDGLGKAGPALLMVINLFMRPSLNVIGLVAGAKLFNIFYLFFTQGFILAVNDIMGTIGIDDSTLMSIMGIIFLYTYTFFVSAGCVRCYSLIYQIPDKFLTWIGAQALSLPDSTQGLQAAQRSLQISAQGTQQKFQEFSKGSQKIFDQAVREANKKYKSDDYKGPRNLKEDIAHAANKLSTSVSEAAVVMQSRLNVAAEVTGLKAAGAAVLAVASTVASTEAAKSLSGAVSSMYESTGMKVATETATSWAASAYSGAKSTYEATKPYVAYAYQVASEKVVATAHYVDSSLSTLNVTHKAYEYQSTYAKEIEGLKTQLSIDPKPENTTFFDRMIANNSWLVSAAQRNEYKFTVYGKEFHSQTLDNVVNLTKNTALTALAVGAGSVYAVGALAYAPARSAYDAYNRNFDKNYVAPDPASQKGFFDYAAETRRELGSLSRFVGLSVASSYIGASTAVSTMKHGSDLTAEEKGLMFVYNFVPSIPGQALMVSANLLDGFDKQGRAKLEQYTKDVNTKLDAV